MGKLLGKQLYQQDAIDRINKKTGKEYERRESIKFHQRCRYERDQWEKESLFWACLMVVAGILTFIGAMCF